MQVKALLAGAMATAVCVISANKGIHEGLSALLTKQERVEGEALDRWLQHVVVSGKAEENEGMGTVGRWVLKEAQDKTKLKGVRQHLLCVLLCVS